MRKNLKKVLLTAIFLAVLLGMFWYVKGHLSEFLVIKNFSLKYFLPIFLITFGYYLVQGLILKAIVEPFQIKLKIREWFGLTMITLLGNYLFPFSGFGFRAAYLKKFFSFRYTYFLSTLALLTLVEFTFFSFGGLISLLYLYNQRGLINIPLTSLFGIILIASLMILVLPVRLKSRFRFLQKIAAILDNLSEIKKNKVLMEKLYGLTFWEFIFFSLIFFFTFKGLSLDIPAIASFLPAGLSDYSLFIRILPASFGFYEGAVIIAAKQLGFSVSEGLLVTAVVRLASIIWIFALGLVFSYILMVRGKKK